MITKSYKIMVTLDQSLKMYSHYFGLHWQNISSSRIVIFFRIHLRLYAHVNLTSLFIKDFINPHSNPEAVF